MFIKSSQLATAPGEKKYFRQVWIESQRLGWALAPCSRLADWLQQIGQHYKDDISNSIVPGDPVSVALTANLVVAKRISCVVAFRTGVGGAV